MANTLRFKRGLVSGIPTAALGEPLFTTDTFDLYIGNGTTNTRFQKYIASGTTSQLLRGDGSLLTMPIVLTSPSNGQVLKFNGTNWVNDSDAGITGSGASGQVAYFTGATTQSGSNNLFWDATNNRLGVGTASPIAKIHLSSASGDHIKIDRTGQTDRAILVSGSNLFSFGTWSNPTQLNITSTGNILVNSTTDNGLRFQVTGDGYFSGSVGIGTTVLGGYNLHVNKNLGGSAGTTYYNIVSQGQVLSDVTGNATYYLSFSRTQAATFTLSTLFHYVAQQGTFGAGSSVTNQYGFYAHNALTGATNNYGFYGNIASGTGRWNLYMNGTAANYLAGDLGIGISPAYKFHAVSSATTIGAFRNSGAAIGQLLVGNTAGDLQLRILASGDGFIFSDTGKYLAFGSNGATERMRLDASGNLGLGVTPSAWYSTVKSIEVNTLGSISQNGGPNGRYSIAYNATQTGALHTTGWVYNVNDFAVQYKMNQGQHQWFIAPSGTAGNAITFTQAMTLDASGNLLVGSTTAGGSTTPVNISLGSAFGTNTAGSTSNIKLRLYDDGVNTNHYGFGVSSNLMEVSFPSSIAFYNGASASRTERMRLNANGRLILGVAADSGETFQVNGTMRVSGASTFGGNMTISKNENNITTLNISNTTAGTGSQSYARLTSDASSGVGQFGKYSSTTTAYKILTASNTYLYNATAGDIAILNDVASGSIKMAAGGSSTAHFTIASTGAATFSSSVTAGGFITTNSSTVTSPIDTLSTKAYFNASSISGAALTLVADSLGRTFRISSNTSGTVIGAFDASPSSVIIGTNTVHPFVFNIAASERMRLDASGNLGIGMTPSYKLDVTGEARVSNAIAIGTTPDTNKPFKILKNINGTVGINFENTSTGSLAFSAIQMGTDVSGGTKFTNLVYASSGVTASGVYNPDGTSLINNGSGGLNFLGNPIRMYTGGSNGTLRWDMTNDGFITQYTGTNPSTSATDGYRQYSADVVAGNAAPHFRTENGAVIKLYQETTGVGNAIFSQGGGNSVLDDSTFDGYTLRQIVKALRNQGILA